MATKAIGTPPDQPTSRVNLTQPEIDAIATREANWISGADGNKAALERVWRDEELAKSDWMALPDSPTMTAAWTTYRQELRDLPTLTGFPTTHTRPTAP